uniref:Zgc:100829 n=1 Tax=Oryzias sinensis TaxID=183150 RepID=A0A8C7ZHA5_9TELE
MLQQVLKEMYIDPDVLQALNEEQKKILFLKMREEQVRRWKEREEKLGREPELKPAKQKSANGKSVSWQLGRDGEVSVSVMGEVDELTSKFLSSKLLEKPQKERGVQNIFIDRKDCEKPQTENAAPKTKPDVSSILKQGKPEKATTSLPLPVSVSDPPQSAPAVEQVEVKPVVPIKETSAPPPSCTHINQQKLAGHRNAQKRPVEDPSKTSIYHQRSGKPSDLAKVGQVVALIQTFSQREANCPPPAPFRGVKPPLPNKPHHLRPTNL